MRTIGWTLACALLILSISGRSRAAGAESNAIEEDEVRDGRLEVGGSVQVGNESRVDSDLKDLDDLLDDLFDVGGEEQENVTAAGRTFGHKRLQFMLMPMMYKMGVMMTMLTVVALISLKGLLVGVLLLILKLSTFLAKLHPHHQQAWSPQPIHVHVHNSHPHSHGHVYGAWEPASGPADDEHYYYKG